MLCRWEFIRKAAMTPNPLLSAAGHRWSAPLKRITIHVPHWWTLKSWMLFQIIICLKENSKPVYEIGVNVAGLWPCIFCRSIRELRRTAIRVIQCGQYAFVIRRNLQSSKTRSKLLIDLKKDKSLFTRPELRKLGCGRAYSVAQSGLYATPMSK